jgi:hypothetical protein
MIYRVLKTVDAYVRCTAEIDAESPASPGPSLGGS